MVHRNVLVASITEDVLLGADFLQDEEDGPVDIFFSQGKMRWKGLELPFLPYNTPANTRKVHSADHYIVPAMSEMIMDVYVERTELNEAGDVLIEPHERTSELRSLVIANCIVNLADNATVKIRVMNTNIDEISIKQDTVLGLAHRSIQQVTPLFDSECAGEVNCDEMRSPPINSKTSTKLKRITKKIKKTTCAISSSYIPEHLVDLYENTAKGKGQQECEEVTKLLVEFQDTFSKGSTDLGLTSLTEHVIDTKGATPIKQRPRRTPRAFEGEDKAALQKLQEQGSIRPSTSPWASPIVLVRKKDGTVRPCVDYRRLNAVTKPDAFPLPRTDDCLDAMSGSVLFSTLDITSAYNQIPVRKEDIQKTAFTTKFGLFEYTTMPFGLSNAPATFQRVMEVALRGLQWTICLIYLDDVIIFGRNLEEHINRLREVLSRIKAAGLKLSPRKCFLLQKEVKFLEHVVSEAGVLPNPDNVQKLVEWSQPKTVTDVRAILGLGSYYRRFVKDFSKLVHPLIQLTRKDTSFIWTDDCEEAFQKLKVALVGPDVMGYPRQDCSFILDTDACDVSIGAVLSQFQDGRERVIAYASRVLNKTQRNYCVTDRELLAVVHFITHFRHYLMGTEFTVRTDHQALKWLFSLREPRNRIARWVEELSAFHFTIEYRPGKQHGNADGMSRCSTPQDCQCSNLEDQPLKCGPCHKCNKRAQDMDSSSLLTPIRAVTQQSVKSTPVNRLCRTLKFIIYVVFLWMWSFPLVKSTNSNDVCGHGYQDILLKNNTNFWPTLECFFYRKSCRQIQTRSKSKNPKNNAPGKVTTKSKIGWASNHSLHALQKKQKEDPDIGPIFKWVESGERPFGTEVCATSPATRHYWNNWNRLKLRDGLLFRNYGKRDDSSNTWQFIVPRDMRKEIMDQMHKSIISGHYGKRKTGKKTLERFYWFELRSEIDQYITRCDCCAANKAPCKRPRAPLGDMRVGYPMDRLATDILGPLPLTERGNRYILVVTDYFTNWVEIFAVPDQTAVTCAEKILNEVISRFGCPLDLHSDQGSNYRSLIFKEMCRLLEIRKTRTSPRNPKCNGKVERFNKTLVRMIRAYLKGEQREWDRNLGCLAAAYRATPHEATGLTPNLLMLGREARLPAEVMFGSTCQEGEITSYGEYVDGLKKKMQHAHDVARNNLQKSAVKQSEHYDGKTSLNKYKTGDYVWYLAEKRKIGENPKLYLPYEGPYLVVMKLSDLDYAIQREMKQKWKVVHHDKLKPYEGEVKFKWSRAALEKAKRQPVSVVADDEEAT